MGLPIPAHVAQSESGMKTAACASDSTAAADIRILGRILNARKQELYQKDSDFRISVVIPDDCLYPWIWAERGIKQEQPGPYIHDSGASLPREYQPTTIYVTTMRVYMEDILNKETDILNKGSQQA